MFRIVNSCKQNLDIKEFFTSFGNNEDSFVNVRNTVNIRTHLRYWQRVQTSHRNITVVAEFPPIHKLLVVTGIFAYLIIAIANDVEFTVSLHNKKRSIRSLNSDPARPVTRQLNSSPPPFAPSR